MALKKAPTKSLQIELKSQEEWDELMQWPGLVVVDAYSSWCGPCKAIVSLLRKIHINLGSDILSFATADTDLIDSLSDYRGKSEPTFLFYGNGQLVNVLRGCNGPMMKKLIDTCLKKEIQIAEGLIEREIFIDKVIFKQPEAVEKQDSIKDDLDEEKPITVAVVKPDIVQAGLVEEICKELVNAGFRVVERVERLLSRLEVAELYRQDEGDDSFEQFIEFMSSSPCVAMAISTSGDAVREEFMSELKLLLGPTDVNTAREEAPESIRAKFGTDSLHNVMNYTASAEDVSRELAFFFPGLIAPAFHSKTPSKEALQNTIAIIRPDAVGRKNSIIKEIKDNGFVITLQKEILFSKEQAEEFYLHHKDGELYEGFIANMSSGTSIALCLTKANAIERWSKMLSRKKTSEAVDDEESDENVSLQVKFASPNSPLCGPLHGSISIEEVERELNFLFPKENAAVVIKPGVEDKITSDIIARLKYAGFTVVLETAITMTSEQVSLLYREHTNEDYFEELVQHMTSGPSLHFILSARDATQRLQSVLGPRRPEEAKEMSPSSIRGQYGENIVRNIIYGSTSKQLTVDIITNLFPDVLLDNNGLVVIPYSNEHFEDVIAAPNENGHNDPSQIADEKDGSGIGTKIVDASAGESAVEIEAGEVNEEASVHALTDESLPTSVSDDATLPSDEQTVSRKADDSSSIHPTVEPTFDDQTTTDASREPTIDDQTTADTSREPTLDDQTTTDISREPTLDGQTTTDASCEPTLDGQTTTDVSDEVTLDVTNTKVM